MATFHFYDKDDLAVPGIGYHHYLVTANTLAVARAELRRKLNPRVVNRLRKSKTAFNPIDWGSDAVVTRFTAKVPVKTAKHHTGKRAKKSKRKEIRTLQDLFNALKMRRHRKR